MEVEIDPEDFIEDARKVFTDTAKSFSKTLAMADRAKQLSRLVDQSGQVGDIYKKGKYSYF